MYIHYRMMWATQKTINKKYDRIVVLIDMDCFYCQVEEQLNPSLKGKPIIVQPLQYDDYGGGGIIALNYVARARGVKRNMRGDEAKKQCPELQLIRVPVVRGKADLSKYRNAGKQVAAVLQTFTQLMTRASVDEAYLDLTERVQDRLSDMNKGKYSLNPDAVTNTFAVGHQSIDEYVQHVTKNVTQTIDDEDDLKYLSEDAEALRKSDIKLLIASSIVNEIRAIVREKTGFECSAGIAHNKILAKLVCGMNKPNKQTLLPIKQIPELYRTLPITKVQGLGGKFGQKVCDTLNIQHMLDLSRFSIEELQNGFGEKSGHWLHNLAHGIDLEAVTPRLPPKSISCSKIFPRHNAIKTKSLLRYWLSEIAKDIVERQEQDELDFNRRPKQMVISFSQNINNADVSSSKTINIRQIGEDAIVNDALDVIEKNTTKFLQASDKDNLNHPIKFLGFSVCKFENMDMKRATTIGDMLRKGFKEMENQTNSESKGKPSAGELNQIEAITSFSTRYQIELNTSYSSDSEDNDDSSKNQQLQTILRTSPIPSTSSSKNYIQTHDQFHQSSAERLSTIECMECGEMIVESKMQVHTDAHLAMKINQEQRAEFQDQLNQSNVLKTPNKTKPKANLKRKIEPTSIQKFFSKRRESTPEPNSSTCSNNEVEKCSECSKTVPITSFAEHMDFHVAKRLQDELTGSENKAKRSNINSITIAGSNHKKSGKNQKINRKIANSKNTAVRNITDFFQSTE